MTFHDATCPCLDCQHLRALLKASEKANPNPTVPWRRYTPFDTFLLKMLGIRAW